MSDEREGTHFGFQRVSREEKQDRVARVFDSVASKYDLMNDLMSLGIHRIWKKFTVDVARVKRGQKVLDVAGGTADLSIRWKKLVGDDGEVWLTDINYSMIEFGREKLIDGNVDCNVAICNAESLPFKMGYFDIVSVAFGLRNMTNKERALEEMHRVLKPGGMLLVLEFSKIAEPFKGIYDFYSFEVLPRIGRFIVGDEDSYKYLAESIRMHPDQNGLERMIRNAGFDRVDYFNLSAGICALHQGFKF